MFLELFPKSPCQLTYVILFTTCLGTLDPIDHTNFLGDLISVFGGQWEFPDNVASCKMYLDPYLNAYILEAFAKPLSIGDHHVYVAVFDAITVGNQVSVVVVLDLTDITSMVDIGLKSI